MNIIEARAIVARVGKQCSGLDRVGGLVAELEWLDGQGNATQAGETVRTLDDRAGHYEDGRFVGGRKIAEAMRMCRAFPVAS